jgi:hypothetical protein
MTRSAHTDWSALLLGGALLAGCLAPAGWQKWTITPAN